MTSVVGILNKNGVAIAADSAVTRTRYITKFTKNGNKMVRLCEAIPVAVMITGNADYLQTPWDVIIRRYRQIRGHLMHATVEEAAHDLFSFIQSEPAFWAEDGGDRYVRWTADKVFDIIVREIDRDKERDSDGNLCRPAAFVRSFRRVSSSYQKKWEKIGICPQFKDYSIDCFRSAAERLISHSLDQKKVGSPEDDNQCFPEAILKEIRPSFEEAVWMALRTRTEGGGPSATLIFAGYGKDQVYPSLVSAAVCEGYDSHVNYHIRPKDIVSISDSRPVAVCPFAQDDVIKSVLRGIHYEWSDDADHLLSRKVNPYFGNLFASMEKDGEPDFAFLEALDELETEDLERQFFKEGMRLLDKNQHRWEKALEKSDLESLASLADCLIDLTGFHRILTFSHEGVGGPVDVAVISKNNGFTWLRRKNWYHKDGPMGV